MHNCGIMLASSKGCVANIADKYLCNWRSKGTVYYVKNNRDRIRTRHAHEMHTDLGLFLH